MKENEIWIPLIRGIDGVFVSEADPKKAFWYEQSINSHRFKSVYGQVYYHENGENKKPIDKKQQLLNELQSLQGDKDYERAHDLADELLLAYIGDKEVTEAFNKINKY